MDEARTMIPRGSTGTGRIRPVLAAIRTVLLALIALGLAGEGEAASEAGSYVRSGTSWVPLWGEARGVTEWRGPARAVVNAVGWREAKPGVEWAELEIGGGPGGWRATVTLVRIDPARIRFGLRSATRAACWAPGRLIPRMPTPPSRSTPVSSMAGWCGTGWSVTASRSSARLGPAVDGGGVRHGRRRAAGNAGFTR
jgi:hypothetical protein